MKRLNINGRQNHKQFLSLANINKMSTTVPNNNYSQLFSVFKEVFNFIHLQTHGVVGVLLRCFVFP